MKLITILGPTAVGKTALAAALAKRLDGEVISADSRQVYKGMTIGTGKDLEDFEFEDRSIPYHLIDILPAGKSYNLFQFQQDFYAAYLAIINRKKQAILCGGTGMYLQAALDQYQLIEVPENDEEIEKLKRLTQEELTKKLKEIDQPLHNSTDLEDKDRTIRAIQIAQAKQNSVPKKSPVESSIIFGIEMQREKLRSRIQKRLDSRLEEGMLEEVEGLLNEGVSKEQLRYYGLEYRFITDYLDQQLTYDEMYTQLLQAIRRFAKKQVTWFRRMEKQGASIHWLSAELPLKEKLDFISNTLNEEE